MKATIVSYPDDFSKNEIQELARAGGYTVEAIVTQKQIIRSGYGVGVGTAQELSEMVADNGSDALIVDESLTSSQANTLAKAIHAEVVDRERLILNIFALRAATTEAKLQVQLAELRYQLPRARDAVRYSVKGEQAGFSGMGETAVDVKFRALKHRMSLIKSKLESAHSSRALQRKERLKLGAPLVSLAGYTSSGKTTLFNRLASETKEESPNLFTTLTTTTRAITKEGSKQKVMLSDTVGFISRIPTYLVESFKSTLEELTYADLVLLVVDASESTESLAIKLGSSKDILGQLGVDQKKVLLVLNKIDLAPHATLPRYDNTLFEGYSAVRTSAIRGYGMRQLRNMIFELTASR